MRKPVIAGNWKLFKNSTEALELVNGLIPLVKDAADVEIVVAPVFTVLDRVSSALKGTSIKLSAQNCYWEDEGAFTGEISPKMLLDAGCSHVIIGHSERRQYFGETDESVNKKTKASINAGLTAIVCVGETLKEREDGIMNDVLTRQVSKGLEGLSSFQNVIIAYEPVWAIGTGKTATDEQAQDAHKFIRQVLLKSFDSNCSDSMRILYGGSVKPDNIKGLMSQPDIDGALVGGASLKADSFASIVNFSK
jgi:triosephosphate isomerase